MTKPTVALAVSGHGYGHAVRSAQVAAALLGRGARVVVRSDAPRWLFPTGVEWIRSPGWPLDIGVVQHDGLELDIDATRDQWRGFAAAFEQRADVEADGLRQARADVVVGDVPPLAFAAAARAGLPSLAVANFTWDWIYAIWSDFEDIIAVIRRAYACADGALRLPLHSRDDFTAFARIIDVPLIARHATRPRHEIRRELGVPNERRVVLLSFGGFTARGLDVAALARWPDYTFVIAPPLAGDNVPANVIVLREQPADYVSLVGACDVVVTKPGYGIVADCLANRVPVLFTERGPFREYDVLADGLVRFGRARFIPRQTLIEGDLGPHLDALLESHTTWADLPMNGATVVAEQVLHRVTIEQNLLSR